MYVIPRFNFLEAERYDTLSDRWASTFEFGLDLDRETSHPRLTERLTAVVGTEMYAFEHAWKIIKKICHVMRYDDECNAWEDVSSSSYDQSHKGWAGVCTVVMDSCLYVIGGLYIGDVDKNGHILRSVSCAVRFNTAIQKWEKIASLLCARYGACGAAARGKIFIAGGIISGAFPYEVPEVVTETCEMYNVWTNEWQFIASLHAPRKNGSMVYLRGCLYVLGGGLSANGEVFWDALVVESYDFERNTWTPKTKIPVLPPSRPNLKWNDIKACTLSVNKEIIDRKKSITRPIADWDNVTV